MSALQAAVARVLGKKPDATEDEINRLEVAMEDFMEAETAADKAAAMKAFLELAKDD